MYQSLNHYSLWGFYKRSREYWWMNMEIKLKQESLHQGSEYKNPKLIKAYALGPILCIYFMWYLAFSYMYTSKSLYIMILAHIVSNMYTM